MSSSPASDPTEPAEIIVNDASPPAAVVAKAEPSPPSKLVALKSRALQMHKAPVADHLAFHSTVGRAVAGAGIGAVLADGLAWLVGTGLWQSPLLGAGVMGGALAAVAFTKKKWWRGLIGGGAGVAGAGLFSLAAPLWPPFAALLMGAAAAPVLAEGQSTKRKLMTAATTALASAAGLYVARVMVSWEVFEGVVPSLLGHGAAGATAGLFIGLAAAPRHLGRSPDPVEAAYTPALAIKDGEIQDILQRTIGIHRSLKTDLQSRTEANSIPTVAGREAELVLRILHIAGECRQIQNDLEATPASEIEARIGDLKTRAEGASDVAAKRTYLDTVSSLKEQLQAVVRIEGGRDRVVARLHATVALLEKLRFALIHLRSADAQRVGDELTSVTDALDALTDEIEATSSAVGEVYGNSTSVLVSGELAALPSGDGA